MDERVAAELFVSRNNKSSGRLMRSQTRTVPGSIVIFNGCGESGKWLEKDGRGNGEEGMVADPQVSSVTTLRVGRRRERGLFTSPHDDIQRE